MATNQKASDISCQGNAILSLIATASKGNPPIFNRADK